MDTQQMIEIAKGFQEWVVDNDNERFRLDVIDLADIPQAGLYISRGTTPELGEFIAHAPRTILALAEENARLQERIAELEAQGTRRKEHFSDSDILPLKTLSECTGVSVYALRAACYRGAIKYWKINNNQHYASTIAEVRRYKRRSSPDQP